MDQKNNIMHGVREYCESMPVELSFADNGRFIVRALNECGNNSTEVDLKDLIRWLEVQGLLGFLVKD